MAVDKKSQHYTSAKNYTDLDGNSKSFTFIDHDVKTKIAAKVTSPEEIEEAKSGLKDYKKQIINRILSIPPSVCPEIFHDFTKRGEIGISWDKDMLNDEGVPLERLRDILTMLENKIVIERIII